MTPEEKRASLLALREAVGRIEVQGTARKGFTPKQRQTVYDKQDGLCGACEGALGLSFDIDHVCELMLGGKHEPSNWLGLCKPCHRKKTSERAAVLAKTKRLIKRETEPRKPSRLQGGGFSKTLRKKFDGTVVRR